MHDREVAGSNPVTPIGLTTTAVNKFNKRKSRVTIERCVDDLLSLGEDCLQMLFVVEALGINLVDILGARRARGEPAVLGDDFQTSDGRLVAGRVRQRREDRLAGQA